MIHSQLFQVERGGSTPEECMDRYALAKTKFALSDGASLSSYSARWADLLVQYWVREGLPVSRWAGEQMVEWLKPLQADWNGQIPWDTLGYYPRKKAKIGGQATFLAVHFHKQAGVCRWNALAVGDTCLLVLRDGALQTSFPIRTPHAFTNHPRLLVSVPEVVTAETMALSTVSGTLAPGDTMLLCTDALAAHLLARIDDQRYIRTFCASFIDREQGADTPEFRQWVEEQRDAGAMVNDDVTLIAISITPEVRRCAAS